MHETQPYRATAVNLRRLQHFIALAEEGRFARAAARVHLSEAAFSRSIQALEAEAGLPLVDREPRGAVLTRAGELVLQRARQLVAASDSLERDMALFRDGDAGELVLGVAPVPAATLLPALLLALRQQRPGLLLRVRLGSLPVLMEALDAQQLDFCLGDPRQVSLAGRHVSTPLGREYGGLYCRPGHPLARRHNVTPAQLARYGIGMIAAASALRETIAAAAGFASAADFPLRVECDDLGLLARLVAGSDLLGLLPDAGTESLHRLAFPGTPVVTADLHAIHLRDRTLSPAAAQAMALAATLASGATSAIAGHARGHVHSPGSTGD